MLYQVLLTAKAEADIGAVLAWFHDEQSAEAGGRWLAGVRRNSCHWSLVQSAADSLRRPFTSGRKYASDWSPGSDLARHTSRKREHPEISSFVVRRSLRALTLSARFPAA